MSYGPLSCGRYFYSLALAIKLNAKGESYCNIPLGTLYEHTCKTNLPIKHWPAWLASMLFPNENESLQHDVASSLEDVRREAQPPPQKQPAASAREQTRRGPPAKKRKSLFGGIFESKKKKK